jgi:hypothetical protein
MMIRGNLSRLIVTVKLWFGIKKVYAVEFFCDLFDLNYKKRYLYVKNLIHRCTKSRGKIIERVNAVGDFTVYSDNGQERSAMQAQKSQINVMKHYYSGVVNQARAV